MSSVVCTNGPIQEPWVSVRGVRCLRGGKEDYTMIRSVGNFVVSRRQSWRHEVFAREPARSLRSRASTEASDGESSGSPYMSTSAFRRLVTVQMKSTCSGVHDDDHTSISGCKSLTLKLTSSRCSQLAAWITMYRSLSISASRLTMMVAFSGYLLTVTSL